MSTPRRRVRACRGSAGASLIEVLVAIIVLSLGLLGLAALQANALQAMQGARARALASMQVQDIFDRMRANRARANDGEYDIAFGDAGDAGDPAASGSASLATLGEHDLQQWKRALAAALPDGDGSVERSASATVRASCSAAERCFFWVSVQWSGLGEELEVLDSPSGTPGDGLAADIRKRRTQRITVVSVL